MDPNSCSHEQEEQHREEQETSHSDKNSGCDARSLGVFTQIEKGGCHAWYLSLSRDENENRSHRKSGTTTKSGSSNNNNNSKKKKIIVAYSQIDLIPKR
mmetsp:Transcript_42035/g.47585  ORF Transcript_42035/g.47585 Transcript_42035/m.47585 type:complete len:99 (+) Transcript_42035:375-671(+)